MSHLSILVEHCNSIDEAKISIEENSLNIKYGINGLGKSTIAKAIVGQIRKDGSLSSLLPFKNMVDGDTKVPCVSGVENLNSVLVFDDEYVNQFVFQQDEVVKNSFEIFVRTKEFVNSMEEIEHLFDGIKSAFNNNDEIEQTIKDLKDLRDTFGSSKNSIHKSSKIYKGVGTGNKIDNIPQSVKPYEDFIKSKEPSKWISWQIKGNEFLEIGKKCPYCATDLFEELQKETVLAVAKEYDVKAVDHLNSIKAIIQRLGKYFSDGCKDNLDKILKTKLEITGQEQSFLIGLKTDVEGLIDKLEALRSMSFFSLRDVEDLDDKIKNLQIDLKFIDKLDSTATRTIVDPVNSQLENLVTQIGILKGHINKHKGKISKAIGENQDSINGFLKSAGYKYSVQIIAEPDSYKMKLIHDDFKEHISSASKHLSYGEKNAFAIVLFMHQVLSENPDLIILDDPISSFDKNKKFAILNELFRGKATLRGKTTIMLTHDIEPAIDVIKGTSQLFQGSSPRATFLTYKSGIVLETPICKDDIQTFAKICYDNILSLNDKILQAIYLRRHFEITDDKGLEYNLLASLFHKRIKPTILSSENSIEMTTEEITNAQEKIKVFIPDFDYNLLLSDLTDQSILRNKYFNTEVGYEKIQLFRLLHGKHEDDVVTKFVNEAYHIENEYLMQLNPHKFESVPEYVIAECTRVLSSN